ncbi:uncharacterized protein BDZ99DRAFT_461558 [Mytilinidion resinicola]|uniref:Secreted protein n=1 Tax=Mytilinidion resinicola TaxID=574789 RepID=A0A6A6YSL3_9PEZI|nr:uncharacterized protein BDZ99DRAFT_461558 [Mytilinidion resinicola]KAF2811499.1 hypothetical protein BDZ99DRAFT_461558 [Mytilinidion resinicola]
MSPSFGSSLFSSPFQLFLLLLHSPRTAGGLPARWRLWAESRNSQEHVPAIIGLSQPTLWGRPPSAIWAIHSFFRASPPPPGAQIRSLRFHEAVTGVAVEGFRCSPPSKDASSVT